MTKDRAAQGTDADRRDTISRIAFGLGDIQVGVHFALDILASAALRSDTSGSEWQQAVESIYSSKSIGDLPNEIGFLSALLRDQRLAPIKSVTRRWALLQLAELYANAGDNITARALRKATLPPGPPWSVDASKGFPLAADVSKLLDTPHTAAELEKAGTDFGADPRDADPARRVVLLTKAFQQRVAGEGFPDWNLFLSVNLLVNALAGVGDLSGNLSLTDLINQFIASISKRAPPPPLAGIGIDDYKIHLRTHLEMLAKELAENAFGSAAENVRVAEFALEADRIRADTVASLTQGSDLTGPLTSAEDLSRRMVAAQRIVPSINAFDKAFISAISDTSNLTFSSSSEKSALDGFTELLEFAGEELTAARFRAGADKLSLDFTASVPTSEFCAVFTSLLKEAIVGNTESPSPSDPFAPVAEALFHEYPASRSVASSCGHRIKSDMAGRGDAFEATGIREE